MEDSLADTILRTLLMHASVNTSLSANPLPPSPTRSHTYSGVATFSPFPTPGPGEDYAGRPSGFKAAAFPLGRSGLGACGESFALSPSGAPRPQRGSGPEGRLGDASSHRTGALRLSVCMCSVCNPDQTDDNGGYPTITVIHPPRITVTR